MPLFNCLILLVLLCGLKCEILWIYLNNFNLKYYIVFLVPQNMR
jgi:hypothetical protein